MAAPIDSIIQNLTSLTDRLTALKVTKSPKEAATLQQWINIGGITSLQKALESYLQGIQSVSQPSSPRTPKATSPQTPKAPSPIHTPKAFMRTPLAPSPIHTPKAFTRTPLPPSP